MSNDTTPMPALPEPFSPQFCRVGAQDNETGLWTRDQMREYARTHAAQETARLRARLSQFLAKECRRYVDDYPSARHECEANIANGKRCKDCPEST